MNNNTKNDKQYELPEITGEINCPLCSDGRVKMNRTIHTLPDGEEILILLLECNKCSFLSRDIITLNTTFGPGKYTLKIDDGDLTPKIFRSPGGYFYLPEADFEIEPGNIAGYMITNVEGLLMRMIKWTEYMKKSYEEEENSSKAKSNELNKTSKVLKFLNECFSGKQVFHIILDDKDGGSYISTQKTDSLKFEPYFPKSNGK
ncbi:MAG: ZPR1 zinc finger domain-containing protein [archaeon]|nr:ZPR1 zinc finger domain-containing protein [archaeon]